MRRFIQQHRFVLQLLVFIFGMNAAVGYGACCVDMSDVQQQLSVVENDLPPCHKKAAAEPSETNASGLLSADSFENCCSACVTAIPQVNVEIEASNLPTQDYLVPFSYYVFSNIETPYRPPSLSTS